MKVFVNLITISRIIFAIPLFFIMDKIGSRKLMCVIACFLLTDQLDGFLARKFHVQSLFGAAMDTLADKVLCLTLLILVGRYKPIAYFLIIGEILIAITNATASIKGKHAKSSKLGKLKMWILSITIILGILTINNHIPYMIFVIATIFTILFQIKVIIDYIQTLRKEKKTKRKKVTNMKELKEVLFSTDYYLNCYKKILDTGGKDGKIR